MMNSYTSVTAFKTAFPMYTGHALDTLAADDEVAAFFAITPADKSKFDPESAITGQTRSDLEDGMEGFTAAEKSSFIATVNAKGAGAFVIHFSSSQVEAYGVFKE